MCLYTGQLQKIKCHRLRVNWQLHVATCRVFTQPYSLATVPKPCLVPWVWVCAALMGDWTCLLLSLSQRGVTHTWTPSDAQRDLCWVTRPDCTQIGSNFNNMAVYSSCVSLLLHEMILKGSRHTESRNVKKGGYLDVVLVQLRMMND